MTGTKTAIRAPWLPRAAADGRGHPVVMAVFPAAGGRLRIVENELRQAMLAVRMGGAAMGWVLEGHGSIEDDEP